MLYWALLGLVIGILAARQRGFNMVGGAIGGALLGPLALLLFFVSGVGSTQKVGGQLGRGVLYAVILTMLAIGGLVVYYRYFGGGR